MKYGLFVPYFMDKLDGARNLFTKILLIDLYETQKIKGKDNYIILNSTIMCKKFDVDKKTYFNSLKKLVESEYITRKNSLTDNILKGTLKSKQTKILVDIEKVRKGFEENDNKMQEIKKEIKYLYDKNY